MRKCLTFLMFIALVVMPSVGTWLPHRMLDTMHVLHVPHHTVTAQEDHQHYLEGGHGHSTHYDVIAYFEDYLQVKLKKTDTLSVRLVDHPIDHSIIIADTNSGFNIRSKFKNQNIPPTPPDGVLAYRPVYLSTQRIRI